MGRDEEAVSVIVAAIMLMAVGLMLVGNFYANYAPILGREDEMVHMYRVHNQFVGVRNSISTLIEAQDTEIELLVGVRMGTAGRAYQGIGRAYGYLTLDPQRSSVQFNASYPVENVDATKGNLVFESKNMYFPNQYVVYENGGVIVAQRETSSFISDPDFEATFEGGYINVTFSSMTLTGDLSTVGGSGSRVVKMRLVTGSTEENYWTGNGKTLEINITTDYRHAWIDYFSQTLVISGFTQLAAGTRPVNQGEFSITSTGYGLWLQIARVNNYDNMKGVIDINLE